MISMFRYGNPSIMVRQRSRKNKAVSTNAKIFLLLMISITITLSFYLSHNHRHKTILKQHNDTPTTTSTDPEVIQESINIQIAEHEVVIFSKSYCPYCTNTKLLFATNFVKKDIKIIELDQVINGREIQSTLYQMTGQRTVPSVFVHGHFIGGNDDTIASFESGKLQAILQ